MSNSEKFLWVCELTKDAPTKTWKATDLMELEDEEDKDFVINSLILKTAVLGASAVEGERNLVAVKTNGFHEKSIEQPIFSLTLGRQDMVCGLDLTLASDQNPEVEFKLVSGVGPVFITCTHLLELPTQDEQPTIMTTSDGEDLEEELDEEDEEAIVEEDTEEEAKDTKIAAAKSKAAAIIKNGKGAKNGKATNGHAAEEATPIETDEKPNKRKRN